MVLVDELDYMLTQRQEVLYNLFESGPGAANAGLAVIGIANTLDLPERLDPKVRSRLGSTKTDLRALQAGPDRVHPDAAPLGRRPERGVPAAGRDDGGAQDRGLLGRHPARY